MAPIRDLRFSLFERLFAWIRDGISHRVNNSSWQKLISPYSPNRSFIFEKKPTPQSYLLLYRNGDYIRAAPYDQATHVHPIGLEILGRKYSPLKSDRIAFNDELWTRDARLVGIYYPSISSDSPLYRSNLLRATINCNIEQAASDNVRVYIYLSTSECGEIECTQSFGSEIYVAVDDTNEHALLVSICDWVPLSFEIDAEACRILYGP